MTDTALWRRLLELANSPVAASKSRDVAVISAVLIHPVLGYLQGRGVDAMGLIKSARLNPAALDDSDAMLQPDKVAHFFESAARQTGDALFGLKCGLHAVVKRKAPFYYHLNAAATVRQALMARSRFIKLLTTTHDVRLDADGESSRWRWRCLLPLGPRAQLSDFLLAFHVRRIREIAGEDTIPFRVEFDHAPVASADEYKSALDCDVKFDCSESAIVFSRGMLDRPVRSADADLERIMSDLLEVGLRQLKTTDLKFTARTKLVGLMRDGPPTLETLALELGMSPLTLRRRLREDSTSFRALLTEVRRNLALHLIVDRSVSITEIAFSLGYAEVSVFSRQFRAWFGYSPRAGRRRARLVAEDG